jgi:hypothetical protein
MKILVLCQLMSPLLFTFRRRSLLGYVNSGKLRGSRTELGDRDWPELRSSDPHVGARY